MIALAFIAAHETFPRGHYAAPFGWVDAKGCGAFVVGIRSARVMGTEAHVFAGAGIVEGSVPALEVVETAAKLRGMLDALGVPPDTRPARSRVAFRKEAGA